MTKVIDLIKEETESATKNADERIVSNFYYVSSQRSQNAMEKTSEAFKKGMKLEDAQIWLSSLSDKIKETPTLNFDKIKEYIDPSKRSCDALFYWFDGECSSYLLEFKNTSKSKLLSFLDINIISNEQILEKLKGSKDLILNHLEFSGALEHENLLEKLHCVVIYNGKNDKPVSSSVGPSLPRAAKVSKDSRNHQNKASRQSKPQISSKEVIIDKFSEAVMKLGFAPVTKKEFPGEALPKVKNILGDKIRYATIMAAKDFVQLVEDGYFDLWNWGDYQQYFDSIKG